MHAELSNRNGTPTAEATRIHARAELRAFLRRTNSASPAEAMNKAKQEETKGFLVWLERKIGAMVDELSNKTKLRAYHDHNLDTLLDVLRQNRRKLTINPDTRTVQESVEREFNQSLEKLTPLKARLAATDELIDLIVYRLYGLTEEEVAIGKGAGNALGGGAEEPV